MKVRNGFVSNSSSSSFILKKEKDTREITIEELVERILADEDPRNFIIISERHLCEGIEAFEINFDMAKLIKNYTDRFLTNGKSNIDHILYKATLYPDNRDWVNGNYGKEEGLEEGEKVLWVDNHSIGKDSWFSWGNSEDEQNFFARYFLTTDEWNMIDEDDFNYDFTPKKKDFIIYSEKKKFNKETFNADIKYFDSVGINEDNCSLFGAGMLVYKKLTAKDVKYLTENIDKIKEGLFLYKDLEVLKNDNTFKAQGSKEYHILIIRGIVEKTKKIGLFVKDGE